MFVWQIDSETVALAALASWIEAQAQERSCLFVDMFGELSSILPQWQPGICTALFVLLSPQLFSQVSIAVCTAELLTTTAINAGQQYCMLHTAVHVFAGCLVS